jgi:hypothetical protein
MLNLQDRKWHEFQIQTIFIVSKPIARSKDEYLNGDTPFVASGSMNNGVVKFCKPRRDEAIDRAGCITVSPVDGSAFYQPIDFLGRGGAGSSILMLRSNLMNNYNGRFIARMVSQTCSKYTYGHMGNIKSIERERIMLPINSCGKPDWQFMEEYIKERETALIKRLRSFLNQRIAERERERERERENNWYFYYYSKMDSSKTGIHRESRKRQRYLCGRKSNRKYTIYHCW